MKQVLIKDLEDTFLPQGFEIRHARLTDLAAITEVIVAYELEFEGKADTEEADLISAWESNNFELARDAWVVSAPDGVSGSRRVVAYQEVWNRHENVVYNGDGYVMPGYFGLGIGTSMLRLIENYVQERSYLVQDGRQVVLRNGVMGNDTAARELHENEGYHPARYFWQMETTMQAPPAAPQWPSGIIVRNYVRELDERATFDAFEDAFKDHWGHTPWNYGDWVKDRHERDHFDPSLWWLAMDGDEIAGGVICRYRQERGWVSQLSVRKPWRRRGLGSALLSNALDEFYRRGWHTVGLGVDASNPTGATLIYERAGFRVTSEYVVFEKELQPGTEVRE